MHPTLQRQAHETSRQDEIGFAVVSLHESGCLGWAGQAEQMLVLAQLRPTVAGWGRIEGTGTAAAHTDREMGPCT